MLRKKREPKILKYQEAGDTINLKIKTASSENQTLKLPKSYDLDHPKLDKELKRTILLRDFKFDDKQSIVFQQRAGLGDLIIAIECLETLQFMIKEKGLAKIDYIGLFPKVRLDFLSRLVNELTLFDQIGEIGSAIRSEYQSVVLDASPHSTRIGQMAFGSSWEMYLAKWGIPGRFSPAPNTERRERFNNSLADEFEHMRSYLSFPPNNSYVLFFPECVTNKDKKPWPTENWIKAQEHITNHTDLDVVVMATSPVFKKAFNQKPGVRFFDYRVEPGQDDLFRLFSIIHHANMVLSLDTGPALMSGYLAKKCITLWGPTTPVYFGHRNNINLRISTCPPCFRSNRRSLCQNNVCMSEIDADVVNQIIGEVQSGLYQPR